MTWFLDKLLSLMAWITGRPRLRVRVVEDNPGEAIGGLQIEIENVGDRPTSLAPEIRVTFHLPSAGRLIRRTGSIRCPRSRSAAPAVPSTHLHRIWTGSAGQLPVLVVSCVRVPDHLRLFDSRVRAKCGPYAVLTMATFV